MVLTVVGVSTDEHFLFKWNWRDALLFISRWRGIAIANNKNLNILMVPLFLSEYTQSNITIGNIVAATQNMG